MSKKLGIDLGTTNSAISVYIGNNAARIITLDSEKTTMPSCVMWKGGDKWVVGEEAYEHRYAENVCYSIKKRMGTDYKATFKYEGETIELTPTEVSSLILKELVKRANYIYPDIKDVTITVPADFIAKQREETKKAGELIGLNVVSIISEPTSAALCYENDEKSREVVVYDLGGGTFDVSIVHIEDYSKEENSEDTTFSMLGVAIGTEDKKKMQKRYEVLVSEGNRNLGGDDIDEEIMKLMFKKYNKDKSKGRLGVERIQDILTDVEKEELKLRVEKYKKTIELDNAANAEISLRSGEIEIKLEMEHVAEAVRKVYNKTKLLMGRALANSKVDRARIQEIVLVGGSTKSRMLKKLIEESFPEWVVSSALNPDEAIAIGASLQTAVTMGESQTSIMDVSPYTISVETISETVEGDLVKGKTIPLVKKNTLLPVRIQKEFELLNEGKNLAIDLYLGENVLVSELTHVAKVLMEREGREKTATLIVIIDSNGIFKLKVISGGSEKEVELLNILGVSVDEKKVNPYSKLTNRWRALLETKGVKIEGELKEAFDKFKETGDAKYREKIQEAMRTIQSAELTRDKTSLFKSEEENEAIRLNIK